MNKEFEKNFFKSTGFMQRCFNAGLHPIETLRENKVKEEYKMEGEDCYVTFKPKDNLPIVTPTKMTVEEYSQIEGGRNITTGIKGKKLHLGCGFLHLKGFINIDKSPHVEPDIVCNFEDGLPFPDNYFSQIHSYHVLEHIRPCKFDFVLEEIYRVSKPGCILDIGLPFDNISNRTDYDHYRTFCWHSFDHAIYENKRTYYKKFIVKILNPKPHKLKRWFYYMFPILKKEIYFKMEVVK